MCIVKSTNLIYIQYLAIAEKFRFKGYGSRILAVLKERYGDKRIILEVEEMNPVAPNYEQRLRRKAFYERNGFTRLGIIFEELGIKYEFFYYGGDFNIKEYYSMIKRFRGGLIYYLLKPKVYYV